MNRIAIDHPATDDGPSRASSLRFAFVAMAAVPAASGAVVALAVLLLAPSAELIAAIAVVLFALNALAMPVLLDGRISSRLAAIADALRGARDGRVERVPHVEDSDAIGDIARLANDIVAAQADIGRYAMSLQRAEEFARISDQTMHRLVGGAQGLDRMLVDLQATASNVSRSSERVTASLDAAAIVTDQTSRDFVTAASRAIRSAEAISLSAARASAAMVQPRPIEAHENDTAPALDAILIKLDDLGQAVAALPAFPPLHDIAEAVTAPVLARLSDVAADIQRLPNLALPINESRVALETGLELLGRQIAENRQSPEPVSNDPSPEIAALTEAVARLDVRIAEQAAVVAPIGAVAPASELDMGPFVDSIERLERRLILLTERPVTASDAVDLEPVLSSLATIESKLIAIDAAAATAPVASHPDLSLVAEFDAARAPLQRLLVAFRLAVRDIGLESTRLRSSIDGLAEPADAAPPLDLSAITDKLDDIATRLGSLETATQNSVQKQLTHPDLGQLPEFDAGKAPMQRILVGFRLALREIADSAAQFREIVGQINAQPVVEAASAPTIDLSPIAARLDALAERFELVEAATRVTIKPQPATVATSNPVLPQLVIDRSAMSAALTGLKLMMREMADNAAALRSAAEALPGKVEVIAPAMDLSAITEPLAALREELAAGHGVLAEIHAQMGRDAEASRDSSTQHGDLTAPSLLSTLSLMSGFSSAVETRFNDIEGRISDVARRYGSGSGQGRVAAEELVARLLNATAEMRGEVGKFLAVGAALSREIEIAGKDRRGPYNAIEETKSSVNFR
jgi:hypothetical protein